MYTVNRENAGCGWTDGRIELLKKLWADKLSCSQIANKLGGVTRNAVIGKARRLGLPIRAKIPGSIFQRPRKACAVRPLIRHTPQSAYRGNAALASDFEPEPVIEPIDFNIPVEQRKTLLQLTDATCHWPVGDPGSGDFFFCGGVAADDKPYCSFHCRVAYQPIRHRAPKNDLGRQRRVDHLERWS